MDWLTQFPHLNDDALRSLKKTIDEGFRAFTRAYGDVIETMFDPLQTFLIWSERFMTNTPWPIILGLIALFAWIASRSWKIVAGTIVTLLLIGFFDMWDDTMKTISMIFVCTVLSIAIGIPTGIAMSRSDRLQARSPSSSSWRCASTLAPSPASSWRTTPTCRPASASRTGVTT